MINDNKTLMSAIEDLQRKHKNDPNCFTSYDLKNLDALTKDAHWLFSESYRGAMNSIRHHQVFDRVHALLRNLEKKCTDCHYQKKWRDELLYQEKFNPNHKPAGSPEGGQFDSGSGGGSGGGSGSGGSSGVGNGGGSGTGSPRSPSDSEGYGRYRVTKPKNPLLHDVADKRPAEPSRPSRTYPRSINPSPVTHLEVHDPHRITIHHADGSTETRIKDPNDKAQTRAWLNNNPGNIRPGNFAKRHGAVGENNGMAVFPDAATGHAASAALLKTPKYFHSTIDQAIEMRSPSKENDTEKLQRDVSKRSGLPRDRTIESLDHAEFTRLLEAIHDFEGWGEGKVIPPRNNAHFSCLHLSHFVCSLLCPSGVKHMTLFKYCVLSIFILMSALSVGVAPSYAAPLKGAVRNLKVLSLNYGENKIKIGDEDVIITRGLFPTDNASTRDVYTVLVHADATWQWVRQEDPLDKSPSLIIETWPHVHEDSIDTIRFMVPKEGMVPSIAPKLYLLQVHRPLEMGYVPTAATFKLFTMKRDKDFDIPIFHEISTLAPQKKYCNVDWAAYRELGIPLRESEGENPCNDK